MQNLDIHLHQTMNASWLTWHWMMIVDITTIGSNDKGNKTDLTRGDHEIDLTDTTVTARKGDMTDGTLYLTSTTRKDTLHDPCTGSGGLDGTRQDVAT